MPSRVREGRAGPRATSVDSGGCGTCSPRRGATGPTGPAGSGGGSGVELGARVYSSNSQSIPNTTVTPVIFDVLVFEEGGTFWDSGSNTQLTAPVAGMYQITANVAFAFNATGVRHAQIYCSTTGQVIAEVIVQSSTAASSTPALNVTTLYELNAGDFVELRVQQTSGGSLVLQQSDDRYPTLMLAKVG